MTGDLVPQIVLEPDEESARAARFPVGASITFDDLTEHARIGALDRLRAAEPVSWVPALGGWLVTSWELARSVLGRRDEFSVWAEPNLVRASLGVMMLTSQGDAHTRQRAPFDAPFRMRAVRDTFAEPIAARTDALLAALRPAGECELGAAFAGPFAVEVAADVLGLGLADVGRIMAFYQAFAGAMVYDGDPEPQRLADAARAELNALLHAELARVRAAPDGSITSAVANTPGDLDDDEIVAQLRVVLFGAIETIESLVVNSMALLLQHPDQLRAGARAARPAAERARGVDAARHAGGVHGALDDDAVHRDRRRDARPRRVRRRLVAGGEPRPGGVRRSGAVRRDAPERAPPPVVLVRRASLPGLPPGAAAGCDRGARRCSTGSAGLRLVSAADPVGFAFRKVPELHVAWE